MDLRVVSCEDVRWL